VDIGFSVSCGDYCHVQCDSGFVAHQKIMNKKFNIYLFVAFALLMTTYVALQLGGALIMPRMLFFAIIGYAVLTWLLFRYLHASLKANPRRFATAMMGTTAVKMFVTMGFLGIYLYIDRSQKLTVALGVFAIYITYTIALLIPFVTPSPRSVQDKDS
jgi:hypothetical protein